MAPSKDDSCPCEVLPPPRVETIHLVMDTRQLDPEILCLMWTPDPPYVTGRLKLAMNLVYRSGMYLSQSTWPTLCVASLEYSLSRSTSQAGEFPQVCQ